MLSHHHLLHRRAFLSGALLTAAQLAQGEDWPQFRGPSGQGHSKETGLPLEWSGTKNVRWKTPVPGAGWSSPSIAGDRIWLTAATADGTSLRLLALDRGTGKMLQNTEVFQIRDKGPGIHKKNSFASPTAIVSGDRIFVHYGFYGTACLRSNGDVLWKQTLKYEPQHGPGGSPALFEDLLIFSCDGFDAQFVVALDTATGKIRWKTARGKGNQAYTTPLVIEHGGALQVISPGANRAYAYDPRTGKELWYIEYGDGFSNVPRAVYAHGLVYICSGFFQSVIFAVRPDGKGNVTKSHVAWSHGRSVPLTPSPLVVGAELYMVSDNGIASCLDAQTGKVHWQQRIGGNHSASPVYADGRVYFLSEEGESLVLGPGKEYRELARNSVPERTLASLAISGKAIYLRGEQHLYRIEA
ncbi:MAG: PQQ-binding-like beta-propeller repeat protein [Bryobacterales bacterium]|nr:PQQ-binding-like beta-propeller repeat protein [Bryobacterales bacterium]